MSFKDDMQADLGDVFFGDFNDVATIDDAQVVGKLDFSAHTWADINDTQELFTTPTANLPTLQRGSSVTISGTEYKFVRKWLEGDLTRIVLDKP